LAARSLEVVDRHELEPGGAPAAHDLLHRGGALMAPRVDPARRAAVVEEQDLAAAEARAGALDDGGGAGALRVPQAARPAHEREAAAPKRAAEERPLEAVRRAQERRRLDQDEERGARAGAVERLEHRRRVRAGAVVEGERHLAAVAAAGAQRAAE